MKNEPHYEIPSGELAAWVERQGTDRWWNVDGDPLLTGRLTFPAPGDELAAELRRINLPLLIQDPHNRGQGQVIGRDQLDGLVARLGDGAQVSGPKPPWVSDRVFSLCWKGTDEDWLLIEDQETTEKSREDVAAGRLKE